jgi:hypothetical protein
LHDDASAITALAAMAAILRNHHPIPPSEVGPTAVTARVGGKSSVKGSGGRELWRRAVSP